MKILKKYVKPLRLFLKMVIAIAFIDILAFITAHSWLIGIGVYEFIIVVIIPTLLVLAAFSSFLILKKEPLIARLFKWWIFLSINIIFYFVLFLILGLMF